MSASSCYTSFKGWPLARLLMGGALAVFLSTAWGQDTDISKSPLFTTQANTVKPNLLFILDDSGSMGWDFMPDEVNSLQSDAYGRRSYQCNGVAYDPSFAYVPPLKSDGTSYANASFTAALSDGYDTGSGTVDLSNRYYYKYTGTQPKMSWTFTTTAAITSTTFYKECNSSVGSTPGSTVFTRVNMTSSSTDAQNYANWYSYYRTRMLMMKTAVGVAFKDIDKKYRVGFTTIHRSLPLLNVADFDTTQKNSFYTQLYAADPANSTPLRGALSRAGQYYANKAPSQVVDPVQYSCQHNYSLLSTDGYWNTGNESTSGGASGNFGAYQINNTTLVGQQDGAGTPRPYFDGTQTTVTEKYTWQRVDSTPTTTVTPRKVTDTSTTSSTTATPKSSTKRDYQTSAGNTATSTQFNISGVTRPSSTAGPYPLTFSVTVTTSTNHGYTVGDTVYLSGLPAGYANTVTITSRTNSTFTYSQTFTARPNSYGGSGARAQELFAGQCPSGQAYVVKQPQQADIFGNVTTSQTTTNTKDYVDTKVVTNYSTTTFTQTITTLNGAVTGDTTTSTTAANTPAATTVTTTAGPTSSTTVGAPVNTTGADTTGTWVNTGAATTGTTCVATSTLPSAANVQTGFAAMSSAPIITSNPTVTMGPTTTNGTVTTTAGTTTQGTPTVKTTVSGYPQTVTSGGSSNSLADIAMYYYKTDLRNASLSNCTGALGTSVCADNVAASGDDKAAWQHMTTFTLGLGAGSSLIYDFDYQKQKSGDYYSILEGTKNWPLATADSPTAIDDLWHAAVNGRGRYFSAQNATDLARSLAATLDQIRATTGSASAAATSTLQPVQGDNDVFVAQFTTVSWEGEIKKYTIDPSSGAISPVTSWSVQAALESKLVRNIYYKSSAAAALTEFTAANLSVDGYLGNFSNFCSKTSASGTGAPLQCATLSASDVTAANTASNLINFIRGDKSATYYRSRDKLLGDIVNASPVFVGKPRSAYTENGYAAFMTANSSRPGVVYAAANDGMLHAFLQSTGEELWAYIPTPMLSKLYKLADTSYGDNHDYFVDGTPTTSDIYDQTAGKWRTILVGGYRGGGKGYYALDITDPMLPKSLWEFSDKDMGLSFGNPVITKRKDNTWVVAFTSGYNNNTGGGDGNGHLYVVDAVTGTQLVKLGTFTDAAKTLPAGTTAKPSGLSMLNVWVEFDTENLGKRFYGVDILGNVWRFDIDSNVEPFNSAFLLAQLRDASGNPQPITTLPVLAEIPYNGANYPVVYVATGAYLGLSDLSTTRQQTSYAFIDELTTTGYGNIRAANVLVIKTSASSTVDWQAKRGWMFDYPTLGERTNVNSVIALTTITTATNVPSTDLCALGGSSFIYNFDLFTGDYKKNDMGATLTVGITVVQLAADGSNTGATMTISTNSKGEVKTTEGGSSKSEVNLRRTSWRELE